MYLEKLSNVERLFTAIEQYVDELIASENGPSPRVYDHYLKVIQEETMDSGLAKFNGEEYRFILIPQYELEMPVDDRLRKIIKRIYEEYPSFNSVAKLKATMDLMKELHYLFVFNGSLEDHKW